VDDTLYFTYINEGSGWETWPFDRPFHLILNIAVGGMWGRSGGGIDDSVFPQRMLIDYVRVYEKMP
jgi:beta-glucanase (GH16 family)